MFYLTTHSTHFIYGYMASDMVKDHSAREETRCRHMGYSFRLAAMVLIYASSHRHDDKAFVTLVEYWLEREIAIYLRRIHVYQKMPQ